MGPVEGAVDRLDRDTHRGLVEVLLAEVPADLRGTPPLRQAVPDKREQGPIRSEFRRSCATSTLNRAALRLIWPVLTSRGRVAAQLPD